MAQKQNKDYELRYLPMFYDDLEKKVIYISEKLKNPKAAGDLVDAVEAAILKRLDSPEAFEQYHSKRNRKYPYYRIYVGNFIIYYVVIDDEGPQKIMEVRRFTYNREEQSLKV